MNSEASCAPSSNLSVPGKRRRLGFIDRYLTLWILLA